MKRLLVALAPLVVVATPLGSWAVVHATAAKASSIVIRHQIEGCHTWSLNGGPYRSGIETRLARGGAITITNNDPMVHKLVQLSGGRVTMEHTSDHHAMRMGLKRINGRGVMNHMESTIRLTFPQRGLYRFTTKDLGDYFEVESSGAHHHLMLAVRVS